MIPAMVSIALIAHGGNTTREVLVMRKTSNTSVPVVQPIVQSPAPPTTTGRGQNVGHYKAL